MSKRKQSPNLIHYFFSIIAISIMSVGFVALSIFPAFQNPEKFFANDAGYWVNVCWLALSYSAYFSSPLISMIYYLDFCTCSEKAVKLITLSSIGWFFIILIAPFLVYTIFQVHDFIDWSSIGILVLLAITTGVYLLLIPLVGALMIRFRETLINEHLSHHPWRLEKLLSLLVALIVSFQYFLFQNKLSTCNEGHQDCHLEERLPTTENIYTEAACESQKLGSSKRDDCFVVLAENKLDAAFCEKVLQLQLRRHCVHQLSKMPNSINVNLKRYPIRYNTLQEAMSAKAQGKPVYVLMINAAKQSNEELQKIGQLQDLKILVIDRFENGTVPSSFDKLENLKILSISCANAATRITHIPNFIFNNKSLQILRLTGTEISTLPTEITQLVNLRKVHLGSKRLNSMPYIMGRLPNLTLLRIQRNGISKGDIEGFRKSNPNITLLMGAGYLSNKDYDSIF